ncbi:hypothetical protein CEXT_586421 [Caerostris extrusa]|uniref:Uncharacterized protein n=1 Tax=Caerostris extrusa TaxID=172846 RepID=A0AAV4R935_CAEEX|nr:hypothetical protein CEXT_586421 [Caerostris extrusa]
MEAPFRIVFNPNPNPGSVRCRRLEVPLLDCVFWNWLKDLSLPTSIICFAVTPLPHPPTPPLKNLCLYVPLPYFFFFFYFLPSLSFIYFDFSSSFASPTLAMFLRRIPD